MSLVAVTAIPFEERESIGDPDTTEAKTFRKLVFEPKRILCNIALLLPLNMIITQ